MEKGNKRNSYYFFIIFITSICVLTFLKINFKSSINKFKNSSLEYKINYKNSSTLNYNNILNKPNSIENTKLSTNKKVYLTFDDGPSINNTRKIIDILNKHNVKATFFVTGSFVEMYPQIIQDLIKNNMAIAPHTYSHRYKEIYYDSLSYIDDLEKCIGVIEKITKKDVIPFVRIPGGIKNKAIRPKVLKEIKDKLANKNINYVEWNICSDDSIGKKITGNDIKNNVINQSGRFKDNKVLVVLMHDSFNKKTTVEALPEIIKYYKSQGYEFKTFEDLTKEELRELVNSNIVNTKYNGK